MSRLLLSFFTVSLFGIIIGGLFWIFSMSSSSPVGFGWYLFSFAAGLSMIVLPCTLPLAFVIVPLVMGKGYGKGVLTAVSFSIGVAITLSMYGILAAILGKAVFAFSGGSGEIIKNIFYAVAGVFAIIFALGELGFLKVRLPSFGGAVPGFIQNRQDILRPLLMGLFLGNIGVGCPHPATPIILGQIGIVGDVFYGWLLFFVHALGRIMPLIALAMLGIMGINATKSLVKHRESISKATAWGMVFVGGFLFTLGFFGHDWWVYSGQHTLFEQVTQEERFTGILSERFSAAPPHAHGLEELEGSTGLFGVPLWLGNWAMVGLWVFPMILYWFWAKRKLNLLQDPAERMAETKFWRLRGAFIFAFSLVLMLIFIQIIPHNFLAHQAVEPQEFPKVTTILDVTPLSAAPSLPAEVSLTFSLKDEDGKPLRGLKIDHERILHVQIISEDFSVFTHIHPEDLGMVNEAAINQARFALTYAFPIYGRYLIAAGYVHNIHKVSETFIVDIGERGTPIIVKDFGAKKNFAGYEVLLAKKPDVLLAGAEATLSYKISKDGAPIIDLEPYLAAPMHLAIISADLSFYTHTHGEMHVNGEVESYIVFPFPGLYQVFGEFKHREQVIVTSFFVEVGSEGEHNIASHD